MEDWNPYFQRKRKRNRVSRGCPQGARRYYFWPVFFLVSQVFLWQAGAIPAIINGVSHGLGTTAEAWTSNRETKRRLEETLRMYQDQHNYYENTIRSIVANAGPCKQPPRKKVTIWLTGEHLHPIEVPTISASGSNPDNKEEE